MSERPISGERDDYQRPIFRLRQDESQERFMCRFIPSNQVFSHITRNLSKFPFFFVLRWYFSTLFLQTEFIQPPPIVYSCDQNFHDWLTVFPYLRAIRVLFRVLYMYPPLREKVHIFYTKKRRGSVCMTSVVCDTSEHASRERVTHVYVFAPRL